MELPVTSRAALLQPWLPTLGEMYIEAQEEANYVATLQDPAPLWIRWWYPWEAPPEQLTRMLQAIELFLLLAFADPNAWREVIDLLAARSICGQREWRPVLEATGEPRVQGYQLVCVPGDIDRLREYLGSDHDAEEELASEFARARSVLEGRLQEPVVIPVALYVRESRDLSWDRVMHPIIDFVAFQSSMRGRSRLAQLRSRVQAISHGAVSDAPWDEMFLVHAMAFHNQGVRVEELPWLNLEPSRNNAVLVMQAFQTLVVRPNGVSRVQVQGMTASLPLWSAVASGSVPCDISMLRAQTNGHDRKWAVQWFSYAVLSGRGHSDLPTSFDCALFSAEDVQWMAAVVAADDPLQVLFEDDRESIGQFEHLRISTTTVFLYEPTGEAAVDAEVMSEEFQVDNLRVLKQQGEWWVVLVPGWGRGWVQRGNAAISTVTGSSCATEAVPRGRPCLDLVINTIDDATTALLRLVRPRVATVRGRRPEESWIREILGSCTDLTKLIASFHGNTQVQLRSLVESFESGMCPKLKHVTLKLPVYSSEAIQCVTMLLRVLTERAHAMARQLVVLKVEALLVSSDHRIVDSDLHDVALRMLQSNTHLAYLKIELPTQTSNAERVVDMERAFSKFHNTPLWLGLRGKAAFLSVLCSHDNDARAGSRLQLDADVIAKVFQLAASPGRRFISIQMPRP